MLSLPRITRISANFFLMIMRKAFVKIRVIRGNKKTPDIKSGVLNFKKLETITSFLAYRHPLAFRQRFLL